MSKTEIVIYDAIKVDWTIFSSLELQTYTNYLKETLVFMSNRESLISVFQEFFATTGTIRILGEGLNTR